MSGESGALLTSLFGTDSDPESDVERDPPTSTVYQNVLMERWMKDLISNDEHKTEDDMFDDGWLTERDMGSGIVLIRSFDTEIMVRVRPGRPHGLEESESCTFGVVWGAAKALMLFFSHPNYKVTKSDGTMWEENLNLNGKTVLELGAGTGALGLWIAKNWPESTVIVTDLPMALETMEHNISLNILENTAAKVLPFGEDPCTIFSDQEDPKVDVILCADLLYTHFAKPLCWNELAQTLALAFNHNHDLTVWFMLAERYGTRDITPFFQKLENLVGTCLSIVELDLSGLDSGGHPDIEGLFCHPCGKGGKDEGTKKEEMEQGSSVHMQKQSHHSESPNDKAFGGYPYRMRFFRFLLQQ